VTIEHVNMPWDLPASYSAAVSCAGLIFTSGHLGAEPGGDLPRDDLGASDARSHEH
jgi:hypothetical protein